MCSKASPNMRPSAKPGGGSARKKRKGRAARESWRAAGSTWRPMQDCPFEALIWAIGYEGRIAITDGRRATVATVERRYEQPAGADLPAWCRD